MTDSGLVFDIRRFSVHDGAGLRTTVFLKGCPLRCRWCHNPEGIETFCRPVWLSSACIHCEACTKKGAALAFPVLAWEGEKLRIRFMPGDGSNGSPARENWDALVDACPARALVWNGRFMSTDEVMREIEKDAVFFAHGGGCTLSGGEPLAQPAFALSLLKVCRRAGIHTALETSLYAPPETVDEAAALCDQIFADCKIVDGAQHERAAGVDNELILGNLKRLLSGKYAARITVRTPLIPGWTDDDDNIAAIAEFIATCDTGAKAMYELINYNPLAASKYPHGALIWTPGELKPLSAERIGRLRELAREKGARCVD
jgi:pyruvate formate lyase activating enzyme